jgi:hypothetical protein
MDTKTGSTVTKLAVILGLGVLACGTTIAQNAVPNTNHGPNKPNILFVIMDDVGIDQMTSFGYGGNIPGQTGPNNIPPLMPNIDAVAKGGIRFRNTWSMPECSPGRSVMFTGRLPLRNNIYQAIGPNDLNNSQVATWETTTPKLLKQANYTSGLFGKFHLGGPENNQFKDGAPASLGWDYFYGWTAGLPGAIDTTAGGVGPNSGPSGTYSCGFVPSGNNPGGANSGACYIPDQGSISCKPLSGTNPEGDSVGLQCLSAGGVLVPDSACKTTPPAAVLQGLNQLLNAHYVSPLVINRGDQVEEVPLNDGRGRGFRATIEVDAAIRWINEQSGSRHPWMATVSFSADHTPLQPPPGKMLSPATRAYVQQVVATGGGCTTTGLGNSNVQLMSNALTEGMDYEFGRLLVETGIAHYNADGRTVSYNPQDSNTIIVIVGDNGSLGSTVKLPFDPGRSKATAYQTGAWVPLIVAGPLVKQPDRDVNNMVNVADLFSLFGEVAGINVKQSVPRPIDAYPLLPYLTNPQQASLRDFNFTQGGFNIQADGAHNPPCVVPFPQGVEPPFPATESIGLCSQVPVSKSVCEDNYGVWWGPGADPGSTFPGFTGVNECWEVNQALFKHLDDTPQYIRMQALQLTEVYTGIRNDHYKIVKNHLLNYNVASDGPVDNDSIEFYEINQDPPATLKLDLATANLFREPCSDINNCDTKGLTPEQRRNWDSLSHKLTEILASSPACPGDGNGDGRVNGRDLRDWRRITNEWTGSSHYDFNFDGLTNEEDKAIIEENLNKPCPRTY